MEIFNDFIWYINVIYYEKDNILEILSIIQHFISAFTPTNLLIQIQLGKFHNCIKKLNNRNFNASQINFKMSSFL